RSGGGGGETFAGFHTIGNLLHRAGFEPDRARQYGAGDLSARCADPARHHPSGRRDDVYGEEHHPRQYRHCVARSAGDVSFFTSTCRDSRGWAVNRWSVMPTLDPVYNTRIPESNGG